MTYSINWENPQIEVFYNSSPELPVENGQIINELDDQKFIIRTHPTRNRLEEFFLGKDKIDIVKCTNKPKGQGFDLHTGVLGFTFGVRPVESTVEEDIHGVIFKGL